MKTKLFVALFMALASLRAVAADSKPGVSRRNFIVGTAGAAATSGLLSPLGSVIGPKGDQTATTAALTEGAAAEISAANLATSARATALLQAVLLNGVDMMESTKPEPNLQALIDWHPLRRKLGTIYAEAHNESDPAFNTGLDFMFNGAGTPELNEYARAVTFEMAVIQERLSKRFRVSIERIELEMPELLEPKGNNPVWSDIIGLADPRPASLGFEFHKAFYQELARSYPEVAL